MKNLIEILLTLFFVVSFLPASYLKVIGNKLYDENGNEVRLTGVNWFGFETGNYVAHGLWARDYKSILMQIRDLGFNCIRIPWCNEMLDKTPTSIQINAYGNDAYAAQKGIKLYPQAPEGFTGINLDLEGLTSLEVLDKIIEEAGKLGLKIILDNHSRKADGYMNETLWYTSTFSEEQWIQDWVFLAQRYKGNPTVIGADLNNEPHGNTGMGMKPPASWGYNVPGYGDTDWAAAAERCGNAILQVNPDWLIIVEGVEQYQNDYYWWGGNLMGVSQRPINLIKPEKLVYSPHEYGPEVYNQSWFSDPNFPNNMPQIWYNHFGFIYDQNIGHLLVGEFGIKDRSNTTAYTWFTKFMEYMGDKYSWTFWCFNPNSGDTGGILQDDWVTVNEWKMEVLRPYLAPLITSTTSQQQTDALPSVNITSPSNNSTLSGNVTINVIATDDKGVTKIELYLNQQKLTEAFFSSTTVNLNYNLNTTNYSDGVYTLKAKVYDTSNQTNQKEINITINNTPQQQTSYVNIVYPLNNQVLSGITTIYIQTSQDIQEVEVFLDSNLLYSKQQQPYEFIFNTFDFPNGAYTIKVFGYTVSTTVVSQISITINNVSSDQKPNLNVVLSTANFSNTINLTISAYDDNQVSKIEVYISQLLVASITVNTSSFIWEPNIDISFLNDGQYQLIIVVYDNKQQTSSSMFNITINKNQNNQDNSNSNSQLQDNPNNSFKKIYFLSPNSDGINDKINFPSKDIIIFSSDGRVIKELNSFEWRGEDKTNNLVPVGTYFYSDKNKKNRGIIFIIK